MLCERSMILRPQIQGLRTFRNGIREINALLAEKSGGGQ